MGKLDTASTSKDLSATHTLEVRAHLREVLQSHAFASCKRAQDFLTLIVEHALSGEFDLLRERMIGAEMFRRPVNYDTANDPVVRVKASEVRKKLSQYYLEHAGKPTVRIDLPSGTYVPRFLFEPENESAAGSVQIDIHPGLPSPTAAWSEEESPDATGSRPGDASSGLRKSSYRWIRFAGAAVALGILVSTAYFGFRAWRIKFRPMPKIHSVAVLPFENVSGDPRQDYFADGMTEELIADLGRVSDVQVISKTSSMSYKGTKKNLRQIARELSVDSVVEGTVIRDSEKVRVTADLIDARTDHPIWTGSYERNLTDVLTLQGELAKALADEVSIGVMPNQHVHPAHLLPVNPEAEDFYFRGIQHFNENDYKSALALFQQAVQLDPNFAQAHAASASCYGGLGESGLLGYEEAFSKQRAEAIRAIELDNSLPEGHAELANAAMNLNWDWVTAAAEFNRALELNPNLAPIHERYAVYLERTGKMSEAIAEVQRSLMLDPISARTFSIAASTYYFARQYEKALSLIEQRHGFQNNTYLLGAIYAEQRMYKKSIDEFVKSGDSPHDLGHLGNVYARAGNLHQAREIIARLMQDVQRNGVGRYEIALVYAGMNDKDDAFKWLDAAYKTDSEGLTNLKIDPCLDPLRSDPRFADLLHRTSLAN